MNLKKDKKDVDKLVPVPTDLIKLNDAVKNEDVKKYMYDELVKRVMPLILTDLLRKTDYKAKI